MTEKPNPYQAPSATDGSDASWWDRITGLFRPGPPSYRSRGDVGWKAFAGGQPIMFDGIVFFVVPGEPSRLHAAIALREDQAALRQRCLHEVQRVLPEFFCAFPKLWPIAGDRLVEVRFLASYTDLAGEVSPRAEAHPVDPDKIGL